MDIPTECRVIEIRLKKAGVGLDDLFAAAGIHRITWARWKSKQRKSPRLEVWRRVEAAVDAFERRSAESNEAAA